MNLANSTAIIDVVLKCGNDLEEALSVIIRERISFEGYCAHLRTLGNVLNKKKTDLPLSGVVELILNDLIALNASSIAFADSFIEDAPVSCN